MNHNRSSIDLTYWNDSLYAFSYRSARNWEVYSIAEDEWTVIAPEPLYIYNTIECEVVGDIFYFHSHDREVLEAYSPTNGSQWDITRLDSHHEDYSTAHVDGVLYMFGGFQEIGQYVVNTTKGFNLSSGEWEVGTPMPTGRSWTSGVRVNDLVYVVGGIDKRGLESGATEAYCPYNDTWITFPPLDTPRAYFRAGYAAGGIYAFGGSTASRVEYFPSVERLDVPLPDLAIGEDDVGLPGGGPVLEGEPVEVELRLSNAGDWPARGVGVRLAVDGEALNSTDVAFLDVGGSREVAFPWEPTAGRHRLSVSLDPSDDLHETSESNNEVAWEVEVVPARPDLWVNASSIGVDGGGYAAGDTVTLGADVENLGWVPATNVTWGLSVDGEEVSTGSLARAVDPGERVRFTAPWESVGGVHEVSLEVSCGEEDIGLHPDSNSTSVRVPARPDLLFAPAPRAEPANVTLGEEFELAFTVLNRGEVGVEGVVVSVVYQGELLEEVEVGGLDGNGTAEVRRHLPAERRGTESVTLVIDPEDLVWEGDEGNNMAILDVRVLDEGPDGPGDGIATTLVAGVVLIIVISISLGIVYSWIIRRRG